MEQRSPKNICKGMQCLRDSATVILHIFCAQDYFLDLSGPPCTETYIMIMIEKRKYHN